MYLESIGTSREAIGLMLSVEVIVYMLLQPLMGHLVDRLGYKAPLLLLVGPIYGMLLTVIPRVADPVLATIVLACIAVTSAPIAVTIVSITSLHAPESMKSTIMSMLLAFANMEIMLGTLVSGYLASYAYELAYDHFMIPLTILAMLGLVGYRYSRR